MPKPYKKLFSVTGLLLLGALLIPITNIGYGVYMNSKAEIHGMNIIKVAEKMDIQKWQVVAEDIHRSLNREQSAEIISPPISVSKLGFLKDGRIYDDGILFYHGGGFVENYCYLRYLPPESSSSSQFGTLTFNGLQVFPPESEASP